MLLAPPAPPSPIFERTQQLTPLTTKDKPWRLRVWAGPTARSGSRGKSSNDSKSPWVLPQSRKDSLPPDAKTYTISKPRFHQAHPHHITIAGQKNQLCMKRAWLAFPGHVQCFGARPFRESPLNHSRQQSVFTLCSKPNPPVI